MTVQRFKPVASAAISLSEQGEYVKYEDYAALAARLAETNLRNTELVAKIEPMDRRIAELEARAVNLPKHSVGEVMHMSGFSRDYAEGWCSGNDNAIHEIHAAGVKVAAGIGKGELDASDGELKNALCRIAELERRLSQQQSIAYHNLDLFNRADKQCRLVEKMLAERAEAGNSPVIPDGCLWTYDDNDYKWDSACGESWTFIEDGPEENGVKFCQGCGKPVVIEVTQEEG